MANGDDQLSGGGGNRQDQAPAASGGSLQTAAPALQGISPPPISWTPVTFDRLAMLATARRNRMSDGAWAAFTGLVGSLPATIHDLIEAYFSGKASTGLSAARLIDVLMSAGFLAATIVLVWRTKERTAGELLEEILNPGAPKKNPGFFKSILNRFQKPNQAHEPKTPAS